ncbi:hypothetical protein [Hymenobacter nivis]|uniref:Uncharacterized protein n=1 Tax=Hymenobacter nivis TaxID=1850093 RepID=A0A2Z3GGS1_9BACT|nr:hypothetical protein [Hymenobacter nivis]AWM33049.1 hypothetical protein DDQ68_09855 [Hymenobacter nivis]
MKKKLAWFTFFALLLLWGFSFLPGAVENEAESDFVNVVGKDVGIDAKQFIGPIKQHYGSYKWYHVD